MTADQFAVWEEYSYDMMGTIRYMYSGDFRPEDAGRMEDFMIGVVNLAYCEYRLFPEYRFDAKRFANRWSW